MVAQDFAGQTAIITGGAGGIGTATAARLAQRGCKICLTDLSQAAVDAALCALQQTVPDVEAMACAADVGDVDDASRVVHAVVSRWGRVDALIQTAGITGKTNTLSEDVPPENFDLVLRVNLRGIFCMCRAVYVPHATAAHVPCAR
jgi:NAD(P)-dependent dehydrogenase (short-subunit alcohol dehydrogenase family)